MTGPSNAEVDLLGERLRKSPHSESDLRLLDEFKRSYQQTFEITVGKLHERQLHPTVRPNKSNLSIVAKLRRQPKLRLSRMQDIAGCRIVADNIVEQNRLVEILRKDFPDAVIKDRRKEPTHGYRAVHIIAKVANKAIEIQVRSQLQQLWAELSEGASDVIDPEIKYGGGVADVQNVLRILSDHINRYEIDEGPFMEAERQKTSLSPTAQALRDNERKNLALLHGKILKQLDEFMALCANWKKGIE